MGSFLAEPGGHRDAVFGLARSAGRVLMVKNARVSRGGARAWWDLPGGAARAGETLTEALAREWREETSLGLEVGDLFLVADGRKRRPEGPVLYTWRAFFFHVEADGEPRAGEGIDEVAWVPEDETTERLAAPYHDALRTWLAGDRRTHGRIDWVEPGAGEAESRNLPRHLLILAAAAAVGDGDTLRAQIGRALEDGEARARIEEALLQIVPYCGYPRAIAAFTVARPLLGDVTSIGDERAGTGAEVFEAVYGDTTSSVRAGLERLHPVLAGWTLGHAYGEVLARAPVLTLLERELLAVSILTALGGLDDPLLGHMRACVRLGASADQVAATVQVVPASVGEGRKDAARALLERI